MGTDDTIAWGVPTGLALTEEPDVRRPRRYRKADERKARRVERRAGRGPASLAAGLSGAEVSAIARTLSPSALEADGWLVLYPFEGKVLAAVAPSYFKAVRRAWRFGFDHPQSGTSTRMVPLTDEIRDRVYEVQAEVASGLS